MDSSNTGTSEIAQGDLMLRRVPGSGERREWIFPRGLLVARRSGDQAGRMTAPAKSLGPGGGASADGGRPPRRRTAAALALLRRRTPMLVAGALPVLAFPRAQLDWLAWVALVPGLLL